MNQKIKELQNLYSWHEFYRKNRQEEALKKCTQQINEYKAKYNLK